MLKLLLHLRPHFLARFLFLLFILPPSLPPSPPPPRQHGRGGHGEHPEGGADHGVAVRAPGPGDAAGRLHHGHLQGVAAAPLRPHRAQQHLQPLQQRSASHAHTLILSHAHTLTLTRSYSHTLTLSANVCLNALLSLSLSLSLALQYCLTFTHSPIHTPTGVSTMQGNNQHIRSR